MKFVKFFLCVLLFGISQVAFSQDLHYDQYTTDDGLPSNTIYEIVQDSNGLLWMGTENGLVSFDGVSFERFTDPRLMDNDIIELEISKDGHVTFTNMSNQYCRLEGNEVVLNSIVVELEDSKSIGTVDLFTYNDVDFLFYHSNGHHYLNKLFIYDNEILDTKQDSIYHIYGAEERQGILLVRMGGISVFDLDKKVVLSELPNLLIKSSNQLPTMLLTLNNGRRYLRLEFNVELRDSIVSSLAEKTRVFDILYHENLIIVGKQDGLWVYDSITGNLVNSFGNFTIHKLFKDLENNLWLSTANNGILKVSLLPEMLHEFSSLSNNIEELICFDNKINLVTSSSILEADLYTKEFHEVKFPYNNDQFVISNSSLFVVFGRGFLFGKDYSSLNKELGFFKIELKDFLAKAGCFVNGDILLANRKSVYKLPNFSSETQFNELTKLFDLKKIQCLEYDKCTNLIHIGTALGAYTYSFSDGLSKSTIKPLNDKSIRQIEVEGNSKIWYGTSNNGILLVEDGVLKDSFTVTKELLSNVINDIVVKDTLLYVATSEGISRVNLETRKTLFVTEFEGLADSNVESIILTDSGDLLVSQKKGYLTITDDQFKLEEKTYSIKIKTLLVNNENYNESLNEGFVLDYDKNKLDFEFNYITLNNITNRNVRFKMNNDEQWTMSNGLNVSLPSLASGDYVLHVQGVLTNNKYTGEKTIHITILPAWWQTMWARLLTLFTLLLVLYLSITSRNKRLKAEEGKRLENLKIQEASKREYLQQINKVKDQALQLQMNPHFIFNAMNAIQSFITSGREKDATLYLAKFAKLIRLIFEYSNTNYITMESEIEFVKLYIELEQLRFNNRIKCRLKISKSVDNEKDVLLTPPLLIQPLIENSFKHGLFHKVEGGELSISYDLDGDTIVMVIEDNGIGRKASRALQGEMYNENRHSGLKNIEQRLEIFKYNLPSYENSLEVKDLYFENEACGTRATIKVTINENK